MMKNLVTYCKSIFITFLLIFGLISIFYFIVTVFLLLCQFEFFKLVMFFFGGWLTLTTPSKFIHHLLRLEG